MSGASAGGRIPLPAKAAPGEGLADGPACAAVVAAFLERTAALSCEAAAEQAGVRPDTIRKWRRRLPRWLKASTARRLAPDRGPTPAPSPDRFRAAFRRVLRAAPDEGQRP